MNLTEHYNSLYENSVQKIISNEYAVDSSIDSQSDKRRGITLLVRPNAGITANIGRFLNELKQVEPEQYYQPGPDLHVTVMSIISCYEGFDLNSICLPDYIDLIEKSIGLNKSIEITFKGITASPSCIMVQGFVQDNSLDSIRDNLRNNFKSSGLQQSIDKRYSIQTAHMTVVRFRKPFTQKNDFLKIMESYREFDFGTMSTDKLEFVFNDWYQRKEIVKQLHTFELNPPYPAGSCQYSNKDKAIRIPPWN